MCSSGTTQSPIRTQCLSSRRLAMLQDASLLKSCADGPPKMEDDHHDDNDGVPVPAATEASAPQASVTASGNVDDDGAHRNLQDETTDNIDRTMSPDIDEDETDAAKATLKAATEAQAKKNTKVAAKVSPADVIPTEVCLRAEIMLWSDTLNYNIIYDTSLDTFMLDCI